MNTLTVDQTVNDVIARCYSKQKQMDWEGTCFGAVKRLGNKAVGFLGEQLTVVALKESLDPTIVDSLVEPDHTRSKDLQGANGATYEVKTATQLEGKKHWFNQIHFTRGIQVTDWKFIVFVFIYPTRFEIWRAERSEKLRKSLGENNGYSWAGKPENLDLDLWTKVSEWRTDRKQRK